jgi:uncharacterized protein YkwD
LARRTIPILVALLSAATVSAAPAAAAAAGDCIPAATWPAARADLAGEVVALVNAHRAALGLPALVVSPALDAAATWKARDMAAYGYMEHDDPAPVARTAQDRMTACGFPQAGWAEDIATGYATAQAVVDGWLGSPEHRANIEEPEFRATGVGAASAAGGPVYWSQTFGAVADDESSLTDPLATAPGAAGTDTPAGTAAAPAADMVRVRCAQHGRGVACRVGARAAIVHIALIRGRRTFARASARAGASPVRVRLRPMRRLRAGRYALVVRAGSAARRTSLVVR